MTGLWIGVDVGGTKVLAGVVSDDGTVSRVVRGTTPDRRGDPAVLERLLIDTVHEVAHGEPIAGVGVAAAGFVDSTRRRVMFAPHLPWRGEPVAERLEAGIGAGVVLDNDANCALLGEAAYGAARGHSDVVLVTMGTGVGGAAIVGGQLVRGRQGMAGEFGHAKVVPDGHPCECGGRGCWEQYASGNALVRSARSRMGHEPTMLSDLCHGNPDLLTGPMVTQAAEDGDLVARAAFTSIGDWLGVGLSNLVAGWDPELIVVGGGVSAAGERLLAPARTAMLRCLVGAAQRDVPDVVAAQLGPEAGLIGAATLARSE